MVSLGESTFQQLHCESVLNNLLNGPPERPGTVDRTVAHLSNILLGPLRQFDRQVLFRQSFLEQGDLDIDDPVDIADRQRPEDDDIVDPVQEFRPEGVAQGSMDFDPALSSLIEKF